MRRYLFATVLGLCLAGAAAAETVTLPLELPTSPLYAEPPGYGALVPFDAARDLAATTAVRLHVTGTYVTDRTYCWIFGGYGGGVWSRPETPGLSIGFRDGESILCLTRCEFARAEDVVTYDLELEFACGETPDWSFLAGGAGTVYIEGLDCTYFNSYPEVCICDPSARVDTAELVIDLDPGVPARPSSWGELKARYR